MDSIILDLETRRLAQDVGGWDNLKHGEGGCSSLVFWLSEAGYPRLFDDNDLTEATSLLETVPTVISYNGVNFDIPIIESLFGRKLRLHSHIDLLQCIWEALAQRNKSRSKGYSLDEVAFRTINRRKTGSGLHAPALADQGRWGELMDYCLQDVLLTRDLARFVQEHGGIIDTSGELLPFSLPDWYSEVTL